MRLYVHVNVTGQDRTGYRPRNLLHTGVSFVQTILSTHSPFSPPTHIISTPLTLSYQQHGSSLTSTTAAAAN